MTTQTKPQIHIVIENEQPVTTSRNVAVNFNKKHYHVLEAIDEIIGGIENLGDLFYETTYIHEQNKQEYRQYLMTKDGFTLLAMGFTGREAVQFKIAYIEQFNKMEETIKNQIDTSQLSPELQMFNQMFKSLSNQEIKTKQLENKVDGISDLVQIDTNDWRQEAVKVIRRIAAKQGNFDGMAELFNESYERLEDRARCNLNIRLNNKEKNMLAQGMSKTAISKLNKLDIIQEDHRLIQIYMTVIKDMAIKYKTWEEMK